MDKKHILIAGAGGQVGRSLEALINADPDLAGHFLTRKSFDLTNDEEMTEVILNLKPDAVINAAAYTQVDLAEEHPALAEQINALACQTMAKACQEANIPLVHYSSDYVYHNGLDRPLKETDALMPQSVYAKTKQVGETLIQSNCDRHFIIRTSWVYDAYGQNFVRTMLKLGEKHPTLTVVDDQIGSPTYAPDIAKATMSILKQELASPTSEDHYGIYNFSNEGVCSWYDFALAIFEIVGNDVKVKPVPSSAFPRPAARPNYSVMNKEKIRTLLDYSIPHWKKSLSDCLSLIK